MKIVFYPLIWVVLVEKSKEVPQSSPQKIHFLNLFGLYLLEHLETQSSLCKYKPSEHKLQFVLKPTQVVHELSQGLQNKTYKNVPSGH